MQYSAEERILIWLAGIEGIGPKRYYRLVSLYPDAHHLWEELRGSNPSLDFLGAKLKESLVRARTQDYVDAYFCKLDQLGVHAVLISNSLYPECLRETVDAPPVLFCMGDTKLLDTRCIAVVGSRNCTRYGREAAFSIAAGIADAGVTVVSGLARGVDSEAHRAALKIDYGKTIAVLGCGIDVIYPPENKALFYEITQRGLVISDYPLGTQPKPQHFPARNRIISGLSESVVLIEADLKSGALITVDYAIEQNREVFCVPGSIFSPQSRGPNRLISNGARILTDVKDLLDGEKINVYPDSMFNNPNRPIQLDIEEQAIINVLLQGEASLDEMANATGMNAASLATVLTMLELRKIIKMQIGGTYCIDSSEYA